MKLSLNIKINLLMIVIVSLFTTGATMYWYQNKINTSSEFLRSEVIAVTTRLSQSLAKPVWDIDFDVLQNSLIAEMQNKNIASISIYYDSTNSIMISKGRNESWEIISLKKQFPAYTYQHTLPV